MLSGKKDDAEPTTMPMTTAWNHAVEKRACAPPTALTVRASVRMSVERSIRMSSAPPIGEALILPQTSASTGQNGIQAGVRMMYHATNTSKTVTAPEPNDWSETIALTKLAPLRTAGRIMATKAWSRVCTKSLSQYPVDGPFETQFRTWSESTTLTLLPTKWLMMLPTYGTSGTATLKPSAALAPKPAGSLTPASHAKAARSPTAM